MSKLEFYLCPDCGAEVAVGSDGCRACGPKKIAGKMRQKKARRTRKSWQQSTRYDGLGLPEEDYDYEDFVAREFGERQRSGFSRKLFWWWVALLLLLLWAALALGIF